ncbi:MAG: DUF2712 domain-containing protein [Anaerostipes sp.]|nr:DUF2712 domain-containing protein [Anaerostipes sp.]MDD3746392.1 DUF2712 domain-containing protein [Anaerostipes sp.]
MRRLSISILLLIMLMIPASSYVFAADNNFGFSFHIPGGTGSNGQEEKGRYRQTRHTDNPWKLDFNKSGEGAGTYSDFWLEKSSGKNVSTVRHAKCNGPVYYTNAYSSASETTVYLTAENNNKNGSAYTVSGYWDEETW